jgi:hypothetical protein
MDYLDPRFKKDKEKIKVKRKLKKRKVPFRKVFKWAFYTLEMISLASAFGSIYDTLRLRVQPIVHCFAYGLEKRCNWGIFTCFLGIMFAMYSLTTSVFIEFMTIPKEMKIHETPFFLGFKFGLTFLIRRRLYKWHIEKIKKKYFTRRYHPWDLIMKMTRLGTMIGADVRNVRRNIIRANTFQLLTIILVMYFEEPLFRWFIRDTMQRIKWQIKKRWKRFYRRSGLYFLVRFSLQEIIEIVRTIDYPFGTIEGISFTHQLKRECRVFFMQIFFRYLVY